MSPFVVLWARAFAATLVVELAVATPLLRGPRAQRVVLVALANLASHPLVWFVFPDLGLGYAAWLALAEAWAVVVEGIAYRVLLPTTTGRAMLVAAVANGASLAVGHVLRVVGAL
jgi:hypothetical protein